jgi:hypothetical protein
VPNNIFDDFAKLKGFDLVDVKQIGNGRGIDFVAVDHNLKAASKQGSVEHLMRKQSGKVALKVIH